MGGRTASQGTGFILVEVVCWGADISPTGQQALTVCPSARRREKWRGRRWEPQTSRPGSASTAPSCFQRGCALSAPLWAASGQRQRGGGDSDQPEYQRCEAGMTSPRVCLLSEPCQATLPARSQAPPGRLRQQASASHSRGVPTRRAGSQPGLRPGTSLGASSRLSGGQRCGLLGDRGGGALPRLPGAGAFGEAGREA